MEPKNAIYMIPVGISEAPLNEVMPSYNCEIIKRIRHFIVEDVRTARRFLKKVDKNIEISGITFYELNEHTDDREISGYLQPLRNGEAVGVMSEAGCPGVADPGAKAVRLAQAENFRIIPLVGPSSILLALMASGLNGQKFCFHGYLPVDLKEREKTLKELENLSRRNDMTQIFIETPYRNDKMVESLLKTLNGETLLCIGSDITDPEKEKILTKTVKEWKKIKYEPGKVPTIFLFYSPNSGRK